MFQPYRQPPESELVGADVRESPSAVPHKEPASPRLVTQLGDSLHRSFGPPPEATFPIPIQDENQDPVSPESFDPYSIQKHILEITNNCLTLMSVLTDIYRAPDDDPKACPEHRRRVKDSHRVRAGRMLVDRITAMYPNAVLSAADGLVLTGTCPDCNFGLTSACPEHSRSVQDDAQDQTVPDPKWLETLQEIQRMIDEGIITPDPNAPKVDMSIYMMGTDEEIAPYAAESVAKLRAELDLRIERQKKWPEIEERRRKKLAQIYPSHSDDGPPDP